MGWMTGRLRQIGISDRMTEKGWKEGYVGRLRWTWRSDRTAETGSKGARMAETLAGKGRQEG